MDSAPSPTKAERAVSADGTEIAYERLGDGKPLILLGGAFSARGDSALLVAHLAPEFAVFSFDRRGRGDSGDTKPYAVEREIEDISALIDAAGEPALLFGRSSGAALALEATLAGLPVEKLALYEPPYSEDTAGEAHSQIVQATVSRLVERGHDEEAALFFLRETGLPQDMIAAMTQSPQWPVMVELAPTLTYDNAVLRHGGDSFAPLDGVARIDIPLLAMAGGDSPDWMRHVARKIGETAPHGSFMKFPDQDHMIPAEIVAPQLAAFFLDDDEERHPSLDEA